jgi:hydrogenase maturation protein HypF
VSAPVTGRRIAVQGIVQGVGFRPWVYHLARDLGVAGSVQNGPEGVTIDAFAPAPVLDELVARLASDPPAAARIDAVAWSPLVSAAPAGFAIVASASAGAPRASIPPDLATCDACAREIRDPAARRYRYPFTNCTHCGPRFSIATAVPYDRPSTTMAGFPLCADCQREYDDPGDRRFHAQPIACPRCGPRLALLDTAGAPTSAADPIAAVAALLARGHIVALRGLGGFHLACLAHRDDVVRELRRRKRRDEKPFAVMVRDLPAARALADLDPAAAALLGSPARPIVLVDRRGDGLAASVAPGARQLGLFLPYTPLHELLLDAVDAPLVMTSGNVSDEPMAVDSDEAVARLRGIADGFLVHDRPIATRSDDSVARIVAGAPMLLRRARGFVPAPLPVPIRFAAPVLAVGGQLKNTFCLGIDGLATLGPHVGDLDDLATYESFTAMIDRCERFLGVRPAVVAHDLHPGYQSTRYAEGRTADVHIAVQHHHAHVAAVMAEHRLAGPAVGVAYDGTGYGSDGTAWGGEILVAGYASFERVATFRPLPLPGGERAIHQPWRVALAVLDDAFGGDPPLSGLALFDPARVAPRELAAVRQLVATGAGVVRAHGVGRAFDAAAALVLARPRARFEAQLAMALEQVAEPGRGRVYHFAIDTAATPWQIDLRPTWRAVVDDLGAGVAPARIAARFHDTIAAATVRVVAAIRAERGDLPVVLGGGCFQNARLAGAVVAGLAGTPTYLPRQVPPGDGGLALGQAAVAAARLLAVKGRS